MEARQKHKHEPYKIFFETLSNKARWEIIHLLQKGERNVTGIAKDLGYEQSLVSHHLKRLEICGFVKVEQNGKERVYQLNKLIIPLLNLVDKHINTFCVYCAAKL
ncbi:MAG TPA: metalloregulator ArsR/SmtB family transcription factor [Candidatus Paceibacterota bacterium]